MSEREELLKLAEAGLRHAEGLSAQLAKPDWKPSRAHIEQARNSIKRLADDLLRAPAQSAWRDIETAPKDGTSMLLCHWESNEQDVLPIVSGFWSRLSEVWFSEMVGRAVKPTHWQRLPIPPRLPSSDRGGVG